MGWLVARQELWVSEGLACSQALPCAPLLPHLLAFLPACPPDCLPAYTRAHLIVHLPVHLPACLLAHLCALLPPHLPPHLPTCAWLLPRGQQVRSFSKVSKLSIYIILLAALVN